MKVVVAAPCGPVGPPLTEALLAAGHDVRILGGWPGALPVGARPTTAVAGDAVVAAVGGLGAGSAPDLARVAAMAAACAEASAHLLVLAFSDAHRLEDVVGARSSSWTLQAATTLHEQLHAALRRCSAGGDLAVPVDAALQPVDAAEVVARVVRLVRAGPAGRVPDFGGPAIRLLGELATVWSRRAGAGARVVSTGPGCGCWSGPLAPGRLVGQVGWEEWLDRRSAGEAVEGRGDPSGAERLGHLTGAGEQR